MTPTKLTRTCQWCRAEIREGENVIKLERVTIEVYQAVPASMPYLFCSVECLREHASVLIDIGHRK